MAKPTQEIDDQYVRDRMVELEILTQKDLALIADVDEDTLTAALSGHPSALQTISKLASALKVKPSALVKKRSQTTGSSRISDSIRSDPAHVVVGLREPFEVGTSTLLSLQKQVVKVLQSSHLKRVDLHDYLRELGRACRSFIHADVKWLDVMRHIDEEAARGRERVIEGPATCDNGWLEICLSETPRTSTPRLIPVSVNKTPWRGSGAAFSANGIDYVDRLLGRLRFSKYGLSQVQAEKVTAQYSEWEKHHYFSSIVALAIPGNGQINTRTSVGVLNLNFAKSCPFGQHEILDPADVMRIEQVLTPHLLVLEHALNCLID